MRAASPAWAWQGGGRGAARAGGCEEEEEEEAGGGAGGAKRLGRAASGGSARHRPTASDPPTLSPASAGPGRGDVTPAARCGAPCPSLPLTAPQTPPAGARAAAHCAELACAVPCCAMQCHTVPCHAMPYHATPCHTMPCHTMPCRAMPCRTVQCRARLWCPPCPTHSSHPRPPTPQPPLLPQFPRGPPNPGLGADVGTPRAGLRGGRGPQGTPAVWLFARVSLCTAAGGCPSAHTRVHACVPMCKQAGASVHTCVCVCPTRARPGSHCLKRPLPFAPGAASGSSSLCQIWRERRGPGVSGGGGPGLALPEMTSKRGAGSGTPGAAHVTAGT